MSVFWNLEGWGQHAPSLVHTHHRLCTRTIDALRVSRGLAWVRCPFHVPVTNWRGCVGNTVLCCAGASTKVVLSVPDQLIIGIAVYQVTGAVCVHLLVVVRGRMHSARCR